MDVFVRKTGVCVILFPSKIHVRTWIYECANINRSLTVDVSSANLAHKKAQKNEHNTQTILLWCVINKN